MTAINFTIDTAKCIQCKKCVKDCPVLIIDGKTEYPEIKAGKEAMCLACQHCLAVCPTGALSIWGKNPEDSVAVTKEPVAPAKLAELYKTRRSIRKFKKEPLDAALLQDLLETAAYAPTSKNENSVHLSLVDSPETFDKVRALVYDGIKEAAAEGRIPEKFAYLNNFQAVWESKGIDVLFRGAPHLLIASAPKDATNPEVDACIALSYFEIYANSNGVGTLWDGFGKAALSVMKPEVLEKLGVPAGYVLGEILIFGTPAIRYARGIQSDGLNMNTVEL